MADALALEPVHLVLHDIGGPIGFEWAIENPSRVRSLTVLNTLLDLASFRPPFPMSTLRVPILRDLMLATMTPSVMLALFKRTGVEDPSSIDRETMEAYLYLLKQGGGQRSFLDIMAGFDLSEAHGDYLREGLLGIDKPMQVVWGEYDEAIPLSQLSYTLEAFPLRAAHMLPAKHFLQEEQAEAVAAHIAEFAAQLRDCP